MTIEKRIYTRVNPDNLQADITVFKPHDNEPLHISGKVLDISYRGVRIRLNRPAALNLDDCRIKISFVLPESGLEVNISGKLRHSRQSVDLGLQFSGPLPEQQLDAFLFECVKSRPSSAPQVEPPSINSEPQSYSTTQDASS